VSRIGLERFFGKLGALFT